MAESLRDDVAPTGTTRCRVVALASAAASLRLPSRPRAARSA
jgi:hypothetical protein